jgi:ubiquitin C-terminal hydrolase
MADAGQGSGGGAGAGANGGGAPVGLMPVGLRNLGATCYLNSQLQCYYHLLPFRRRIYDANVDTIAHENHRYMTVTRCTALTTGTAQLAALLDAMQKRAN